MLSSWRLIRVSYFSLVLFMCRQHREVQPGRRLRVLLLLLLLSDGRRLPVLHRHSQEDSELNSPAVPHCRVSKTLGEDRFGDYK
jgi:hypothetical protein